MEEDYEQEAECENCDFYGIAKIPKGTKLEDALCPKCGCKGLKKTREIPVGIV